MEIITANRHTRELACISGKRREKTHNERVNASQSNSKTHRRRELPARVPLDGRIHDVTHLRSESIILQSHTYTSKHTCVMRCMTASPLSPFVLKRFFAASVLIVARTIKTRRGSQLRGKENSYRKMSALWLAKERGSWTEHKSPLNEGHNKWRLFGRQTKAVIDIESNQKCNAHFCQGDGWDASGTRTAHLSHTQS